jgi:hypothetical protein
MMEVIVILAIFALGVPYIFMGFAAYSHLADESKSKALAAGPWWALYAKNYDETGRKLCVYGRIILFLSSVITAGWLLSLA